MPEAIDVDQLCIWYLDRFTENVQSRFLPRITDDAIKRVIAFYVKVYGNKERRIESTRSRIALAATCNCFNGYIIIDVVIKYLYDS